MPFPPPPQIPQELEAQCRASGNWIPILFQWYKYTGGVVMTLASFEKDPALFRIKDEVQNAVTVGLLSRTAHLMLSNVHLSYEGKFGETTRILDRCIVESSIKLAWLTSTNDPERFLRFLAKSLKSDLQLKAQIQRNIEKRLGQAQKIEERMLRSIERYIADARLTEDQVVNAAKLQDYATMISDIGIKGQLFYVVAQSMGSHHIHGNWTSLASDYLEKTPEGTFVPRMEHVGMHINQYIYVPLVIILGMRSYVAWAMLDTPEKQNVLDIMVSLEKEIKQIVTLAIENDGDAEVVALPHEA